MPTTPIRVLIVDDHKMVRQGLRAFVLIQDDLEPVGEAADGQEACALFEAHHRPPKVGDDLTEREREVLALLVDGVTNAEIAGRLFIGVSTVKSHVSSILSKLNAATRTEAVSLALQKGLIDKEGT